MRTSLKRWLGSVTVSLVACGVLFMSAVDDDALRRRLALDSGPMAQLVEGSHTGAEMDELGKKLSTQPDYWTSFPLVREYLAAAWKWDRDAGTPSLPEEAFSSIKPYELPNYLPANYTKYDLDDLLRGVWCGPTHPSELACFIPFDTDKEHLPGQRGLPTQGFRPGHVFFWDSPQARNTLEFFSRYDLEFNFPKWATNLTNRSASGIWNYVRRPFTTIPFPVAVYEGFPNHPLNLYMMKSISGGMHWDPGKTEDPALCFCSAHFADNDVIVRNNFGHETYRVYRVIDGNGKKTKYWPLFQDEWGSGKSLVKLNFPVHPDTSCPWDCFWWVTLNSLWVYLPLLFVCCICCCCCRGCYMRCKKKDIETSDYSDDDYEDKDSSGEEQPFVS